MGVVAGVVAVVVVVVVAVLSLVTVDRGSSSSVDTSLSFPLQ